MTLDQLDDLASRMERKWGIDRLPRLMPDAWRTKFETLKAALDQRIEAGIGVNDAAAALARAWQLMDLKATEQGSFPLPPACYSIRCGDSIVEIAHDQPHATALIYQARLEGRHVAVWTLDEVAAVLTLHGVANQAKEAFPGAVVAALPADMPGGRYKRAMPVDEIPFGGEAAA